MKALQRHQRLDAIWRDPPGWRGFFTSVNHSRLGMRFMLTACVCRLYTSDAADE